MADGDGIFQFFGRLLDLFSRDQFGGGARSRADDHHQDDQDPDKVGDRIEERIFSDRQFFLFSRHNVGLSQRLPFGFQPTSGKDFSESIGARLGPRRGLNKSALVPTVRRQRRRPTIQPAR